MAYLWIWWEMSFQQMRKSMNRTLQIARMEFKMTAANKAFIIITILGPFFILVMAFLPNLLIKNAATVDEGTRVVVVGSDDELWRALAKTTVGSPFDLVRTDSTDGLDSAVIAGELQGYVVIPENYLESSNFAYFSRTGTDFITAETIQYYLGSSVVSLRLAKEGLDPERVNYLSARPEMELRKITGKESSEQQSIESTILSAVAFTLLLYMTILLYGQSTARSVLKEKTSKTVEIMLSSVRPIDMLFGKLIGQVLAAIVQYTIWIGVGFTLISVIGPYFDIALPAVLSTGNLGFLVLFFLLAFFLYSAAYAAIGSGAEDETHLGQLGWPLIVFLVIPMILVSSIVVQPDTPLVVALSFFPFTAPIVMFIRVLIDRPESWQILVMSGIMLVSIVLMIAASAKIFRIGLLMTGKRFKLTDIVKWIRY